MTLLMIRTLNMKIPCRKQILALIWCISECLFFSGYINGWLWVKQIVKEDGYFIEPCNISLAKTVISKEHVDILMNQPIRMTHNKTKLKCFYKKVVKVVSLEEYAIYENKSKILKNTFDKGNNITFSGFDCDEQENKLELIHIIVLLFRNITLLPLGVFLDAYGSSKARIIALCCTAFGSLTMLFSSNTYPWLILPALLMLGVAGMLILLTDLQVANLFGSRRYTVMSVFVGAYFSGGIVIFFMKLTKATGVSLQTSFMFTTIGIVPVLISTIAMLPRSRIPWPLPAEYVGTKKKHDLSEFWGIIKTKLYIFCIIWYSLLTLKIWMYDMTVDRQLSHIGVIDTDKYVSLYALILLLSLPISPLFGIVMDWNKKQVTAHHHILQMKNIFYAVSIHFCIALLSSVTSLFSNIHVQVLSFIFVAMEKVALHATLYAFLTHVHFPSEHFGKLVGIVIGCSGITLILQFPLKLLLHQGSSDNTFYVHIVLLVIVVVSGCHPLSLWYHCRTGGINNSAEMTEQERPLTIVLMENIMKKQDNSNDENKTDQADKLTEAESAKLQITDL
ncbi:equilibrative nucleobase transporter 1-like isoform X2 [Ruditapes philippinarum]|uniref:equilibrative nucleobase transporter 1-like isoform X2 n=1 Tax=Ruditapes philippinarum TaxID=129788 RepID=UPI00295C3A5F|nr:equilibrative nucleobase transporter 1-like isoform X2 [Ruditapes philippinarum]